MTASADVFAAEALHRRIAELEARLAEADEALDAIRSGDVDALVVGDIDECRVFTLESADRPYRLLIEQMGEGAVTLSADGVILYCNHAFSELVGEPAVSLVSSRFDRLVATSTIPMATLLLGGGRTEIVMRRADGRSAPATLSLSPLHDDGALMCGVVTDLTNARARADELADARQELAVSRARAEGEERYRSLFNSINAGFCIAEIIFDGENKAIDYRILDANPSFEEQTGLTDWRDKRISEMAPDMERHWHDTYGRVALTGEPVRFTNHAAALDDRWYDVYAYRVGRPEARHVAVLFNDVSDRRRADVLMRELNATLEQRVAERTDELAAANDRLQVEMAERGRTEEALRQSQKLEAIGQLTGGVAHDFNNLLTIIRSSVDLLRRREIAEDKKRRYIDAISDTADRAAKLTGQLLAYARKQPLRPEVFDAAELIRGSTEMLHTTVGQRIEVRTAIGCERCHVEADANQFETALLNMAVNARDAMNGEGVLTIAVADGLVIDGKPYVAITVADTGQGIAADRLQRIFEPFYTTKGVGRGTGLGLSQVYGFAKQSGGEVRVESEVGRGTAFTLYLPQVEGARAAAAVEFVSAHGTAHGGVLLVEDNEQVGEVAAQLLEELGYTVTRAIDAASALTAMDEPDRFDLVFSDIVMPGDLSGLDLARLLRARHPDLPVVLTTGYSEALAGSGTDGSIEGIELLRKPYAVETLSRVIRQAMRPRG